MSMPAMPVWLDEQGRTVACTEKIKVMQENMQELFQMAQDAFEDGLLMGCAEAQLRAYLQALAAGVENPYRS
ncbi:hypothetical protein [Paralysiella testudinis]|uniref:Uncharacterized protein n=1 Tax=Paralysiella testudinis TaxID=2809020 RepID=A0A892ZJC6_9NEIS|nr:hypothetical protein [Paralysiella testudinis]QRQ82733.1 hypothetical protein JQU52_04920 [Paralysiella testudinis]